MQGDALDVLVSFDRNYIGPFRTMLASLVANNPGERVRVWLLHRAIPAADLAALDTFCAGRGASLHPVAVDGSLFTGAPVSRRYPQEMYYRLLAPCMLPNGLERVLYLDPDILVINPLRPLWETDLDGCAFAAASHTAVAEAAANVVNQVRLDTDHEYYNSGVLLVDLVQARAVVRPADVFDCVRTSLPPELILPDQDVFNRLYGIYTMPVSDTLWNYDARRYSAYLAKSGGLCQMSWVMENTAVLHFCGKRKPWLSSASGKFAALYRHYMQVAAR